jgi:hypothetical protein
MKSRTAAGHTTSSHAVSMSCTGTCRTGATTQKLAAKQAAVHLEVVCDTSCNMIRLDHAVGMPQLQGLQSCKATALFFKPLGNTSQRWLPDTH